MERKEEKSPLHMHHPPPNINFSLNSDIFKRLLAETILS